MVVNNYIFIATWIRYQLQNGNSLISKTKLEMKPIHCQDLRYMVSLSYVYTHMKNNALLHNSETSLCRNAFNTYHEWVRYGLLSFDRRFQS
jgi:hypothetical protein